MRLWNLQPTDSTLPHVPHLLLVRRELSQTHDRREATLVTFGSCVARPETRPTTAANQSIADRRSEPISVRQSAFLVVKTLGIPPLNLKELTDSKPAKCESRAREKKIAGFRLTDFASTSPRIPRPSGFASSCERPFQMPDPTNTLSWTATLSSAPRSWIC